MLKKLVFSLLLSTSLISNSFAAPGDHDSDSENQPLVRYMSEFFENRFTTIDQDDYGAIGLPSDFDRLPLHGVTGRLCDQYLRRIEGPNQPSVEARVRKRMKEKKGSDRSDLAEEELKEKIKAEDLQKQTEIRERVALGQLRIIDDAINNCAPDNKETMMWRAFLQLHKASLVLRDINRNRKYKLLYGSQHIDYERALYDAAMTLYWVADDYVEANVERLEFLKMAVAALKLPLYSHASSDPINPREIKCENTGILASDLLMEISKFYSDGVFSDKVFKAQEWRGHFFEIFGRSSRPEDCARYWAADLLAQAGFKDPQGNPYGPQMWEILEPTVDWLEGQSERPDRAGRELIIVSRNSEQFKKQLDRDFAIAPDFAIGLKKRWDAATRAEDATTLKEALLEEASDVLQALRADEAAAHLFRVANFLDDSVGSSNRLELRTRGIKLGHRAAEVLLNLGRKHENADYFFRGVSIAALLDSSCIDELLRVHELFLEGRDLFPEASKLGGEQASRYIYVRRTKPEGCGYINETDTFGGRLKNQLYNLLRKKYEEEFEAGIRAKGVSFLETVDQFRSTWAQEHQGTIETIGEAHFASLKREMHTSKRVYSFLCKRFKEDLEAQPDVDPVSDFSTKYGAYTTHLGEYEGEFIKRVNKPIT